MRNWWIQFWIYFFTPSKDMRMKIYIALFVLALLAIVVALSSCNKEFAVPGKTLIDKEDSVYRPD
jgi:hypothetical protein